MLEKILEAIEEHAIEFEAFGVSDDYISVGWVKDIIHKHMNDGWIPCEERLPENGDTGISITDSLGKVWNDMCYGYAEEDEKPCFHKWDEEMWRCFKPNVIAWHLPLEPYRPKGAEE